MNYIGEISCNFWGTYFEVFDRGFDKALYEKSPKFISTQKKLLGVVKYETNIMGECPRYFSSEIYLKDEVYKLENVRPEWNEAMDCYCLNFYGRVKKASARNFQMYSPDDPENILFQHGKFAKDEFNIDFREPFNYLNAFALGLISIGRKRIVS